MNWDAAEYDSLYNSIAGQYQGWPRWQALADYTTKNPNALTKANGGIPTFDFDYEAAAKEAYGELGTYYLRLLTESQGDTNKILSRLTEDYDTGKRNRATNQAFVQEGYDLQSQNAARLNERNAIARGIASTSAFSPGTGLGVADENLDRRLLPIRRNRQASARSFELANTAADTALARNRVDIPEKQSRYEAELERKRRVEAAQIADSRASRAYNKYLAEFGG